MKQKAFDYLLTIPRGMVVTYGQVAEHVGNKNLARVVGNILHHNPDEKKYPCYKVVNSQGKLSENFAFGGLRGQKKKLEAEGIVVEEDKVNLKKYQYKEKIR
ncbi:MAG: MGMT family protein [Clostridia bacterium]|nr:MGMT family protein [Clostridia bacterium]